MCVSKYIITKLKYYKLKNFKLEFKILCTTVLLKKKKKKIEKTSKIIIIVLK